MSTPNVANLLRVPGRFSVSPTSLATAYPHGGTALGTTTEVSLAFGQIHAPITAEEFGGQQVDAVYAGEQPRVYAYLQEFDADALAVLFPCYAAGTTGGPTLICDVNSSVRAGSRLGDLARVLVFTPDSPDGPAPWLLGRRAVPMIEETIRIAQRGNQSWGVPVVWMLTPDTNGRVYTYAQRRDISL